MSIHPIHTFFRFRPLILQFELIIVISELKKHLKLALNNQENLIELENYGE